MNRFTSKFILNKFYLAFLILCCLFISENIFSIQHWNSDYYKVYYDAKDDVILMNFEFFDYDFGPASENGYLERCNFLYSSDLESFTNFMSAETGDQDKTNWSWVNMKNKLAGIQLQFNECYDPIDGSFWPEKKDQRVEVHNKIGGRARLRITWYHPTKDVKYIRIIGKWHVNGVWSADSFDETYKLERQSPSASKIAGVPVTENNTVKISKEPEQIVITGAKLGDLIHVYTTTGEKIKSIVVNNDIVKIKLPVNRIYIVQIGRTNYKVVL